MLRLTCVLFLAVAASSARDFSMTNLHVKYSTAGTPGVDSFFALPRTESDAESQGWVVPKETKKNTLFQTRCKKDDGRICVLFDKQGSICGYQISIPRSVDDLKMPGFNYNKKGFKSINMFDKEYYSNQIFFVSQETIKNGGRAWNNLTGDSLWLQIGDVLTKIPTKMNQMSSTDFVKQNCFARMGHHYFYKANKKMTPEEFMPWFILFDNDENLTGFGFMSFGSKQSDFQKATNPWFENLPASANANVAPSSPDWVSKYNELYGIFTQHVYLGANPWTFTCPKTKI